MLDRNNPRIQKSLPNLNIAPWESIKIQNIGKPDIAKTSKTEVLQMPSAIKVSQRDFEFFIIIEFFKIIKNFKILKFSLQNILNNDSLILKMSGCFFKLSKIELVNS